MGGRSQLDPQKNQRRDFYRQMPSIWVQRTLGSIVIPFPHCHEPSIEMTVHRSKEIANRRARLHGIHDPGYHHGVDSFLLNIVFEHCLCEIHGFKLGEKMQRDKSLFEHRDIPSLLAFKELREDPTGAPVKCVPRGSNACHDGSHRRVLPVRSFPAE